MEDYTAFQTVQTQVVETKRESFILFACSSIHMRASLKTIFGTQHYLSVLKIVSTNHLKHTEGAQRAKDGKNT